MRRVPFFLLLSFSKEGPKQNGQKGTTGVLDIKGPYFCRDPFLLPFPGYMPDTPYMCLPSLPICDAVLVLPKPTFFQLAGNQGMEKKMETAIMGYIGTTVRIHSFIPS